MNELKYKNREEMVYKMLRDDILNLKIKPGEILSENEICERFGVSRTPVRNALRLLEDQDFLITAPYRGIYVTLLSLSSIKQMIYMRLAVEDMILEDLIGRKDIKSMLDDLRYLIRKQEDITKEKNFLPEQFYRLDSQMHGVWFNVAKKNKLWEILQGQRLHYTRFRMLDFVTETDFSRIITEHKNIVDLIEKRDINGVKEAMKNHLYYSMKRMRYQINVEYKDYFENEPEEGKFDI